jgi:hypothetical protein
VFIFAAATEGGWVPSSISPAKTEGNKGREELFGNQKPAKSLFLSLTSVENLSYIRFRFNASTLQRFNDSTAASAATEPA